MSYGLKITNSDNSLLIDDAFRVYRVIASGTVTATNPPPDAWFGAFNLPSIAQGKIFAFRCVNASSYFIGSIDGSMGYPSVAGYGTVDYVVLDYASSNLTSNHGLIVRNGSNQVTFNSNDSLFLIKQVNAATFPSETSTPTFNIPTSSYTVVQTIAQATILKPSSGAPYDYGTFTTVQYPTSSSVKYGVQVSYDIWGSPYKIYPSRAPYPLTLYAACGVVI